MKNNSNNYIAQINLGMAMLEGKNLLIENAITHFEEAISIYPDHPSGYLSLGLGFQLKNENEKAILNYKKAIELDPYEEGAFYNLAIVYMKIGAYDEALKYFEKTLVISPNSAKVYNGLGAVYAKQGDIDTALANFSKAYDLGFSPAQKNVQEMILAKEKNKK